MSLRSDLRSHAAQQSSALAKRDDQAPFSAFSSPSLSSGELDATIPSDAQKPEFEMNTPPTIRDAVNINNPSPHFGQIINHYPNVKTSAQPAAESRVHRVEVGSLPKSDASEETETLPTPFSKLPLAAQQPSDKLGESSQPGTFTERMRRAEQKAREMEMAHRTKFSRSTKHFTRAETSINGAGKAFPEEKCEPISYETRLRTDLRESSEPLSDTESSPNTRVKESPRPIAVPARGTDTPHQSNAHPETNPLAPMSSSGRKPVAENCLGQEVDPCFSTPIFAQFFTQPKSRKKYAPSSDNRRRPRGERPFLSSSPNNADSQPHAASLKPRPADNEAAIPFLSTQTIDRPQIEPAAEGLDNTTITTPEKSTKNAEPVKPVTKEDGYFRDPWSELPDDEFNWIEVEDAQREGWEMV